VAQPPGSCSASQTSPIEICRPDERVREDRVSGTTNMVQTDDSGRVTAKRHGEPRRGARAICGPLGRPYRRGDPPTPGPAPFDEKSGTIFLPPRTAGSRAVANKTSCRGIKRRSVRGGAATNKKDPRRTTHSTPWEPRPDPRPASERAILAHRRGRRPRPKQNSTDWPAARQPKPWFPNPPRALEADRRARTLAGRNRTAGRGVKSGLTDQAACISGPRA